MTFRRKTRALAACLAAWLFLASGPLQTAQAGMVPTDEILAEETANADRERLMQFLTRDDVRRQLEAMGIDPAEARARAGALSDADIAQIATHLKDDPAGQSAVGAVVGAAVVIFLVLLITDLLCLTKVFPFTRCAAR